MSVVAKYSQEARILQKLYDISIKNNVDISVASAIRKRIQNIKYKPAPKEYECPLKNFNQYVKNECTKFFTYYTWIRGKHLQQEVFELIKPSYALHLCLTGVKRIDHYKNTIIAAKPIVCNRDESIYELTMMKPIKQTYYSLKKDDCELYTRYVHRFKKPNTFGNLCKTPEAALKSSKKSLIKQIVKASQ